jgi:hypothetical protein
MHERVIEPSEIIVEQPGKVEENISKVNPWIRCIARFFDYSLFFLLLLSTRKLFHGQLPFGKYEHLVPFEYFIWIPFEALFLSTLGTTPGKFFLRTKLNRKRLEFNVAIRRSFSVWIRGLGLGIPVLNALCLIHAFQKLKLTHTTSWDRDDRIVVTHYPIGKWRLYIAVLIAAGGILYYYSQKNVELRAHTSVERTSYR